MKAGAVLFIETANAVLKRKEPRDTVSTEVQGISFVGYTGSEGSKPRLWNLQNLCPVPPYSAEQKRYGQTITTIKKSQLERKTTQVTINSNSLSYFASLLFKANPENRTKEKKKPTERQTNLTGCPTN